jgi:hypothetical protein
MGIMAPVAEPGYLSGRRGQWPFGLVVFDDSPPRAPASGSGDLNAHPEIRHKVNIMKKNVDFWESGNLD